MPDPEKPHGPVTPAQLKESGLEWVLCGGLSVGLYTQPKVWRLRPKNEVQREAIRSHELQNLAGISRALFQAEEALAEAEKRLKAILKP